MISTATKTLQANNKMIYVALLSTLTFFLFLDYIPGLEAWSAWVTPPVAFCFVLKAVGIKPLVQGILLWVIISLSTLAYIYFV